MMIRRLLFPIFGATIAKASLRGSRVRLRTLLLIGTVSMWGCRPAREDTTPLQPSLQVESTHTAWFVDQAAELGLDFEHQSGHQERFLFPEIMGGGVALLDMDRDGDLDVYFVQSGSLTKPLANMGNRLYRNEGGTKFVDVTASSGAVADAGYGMGVAAGDYDNDGDTDLYVTNVGPNVLLRNDGSGHFDNVTEAAGVGDPGWGTSAAFVDYDRDGDLDLFICNYVTWSLDADLLCQTPAGQPDYCSPNSYNAPQTDLLYQNQGDGTFVDVSAEAHIRSATGNGLGVVCGDFDGDNDTDIFVANDSMHNHLWQNQGEGIFENVALATGCAVDKDGTAKAGMGTCAADIDGDDDLDLLVVNLLQRNRTRFSATKGPTLWTTHRSSAWGRPPAATPDSVWA